LTAKWMVSWNAIDETLLFVFLCLLFFFFANRFCSFCCCSRFSSRHNQDGLAIFFFFPSLASPLFVLSAPQGHDLPPWRQNELPFLFPLRLFCGQIRFVNSVAFVAFFFLSHFLFFFSLLSFEVPFPHSLVGELLLFFRTSSLS